MNNHHKLKNDSFKNWLESSDEENLKRLGLKSNQFSIDDTPDKWLGKVDTMPFIPGNNPSDKQLSHYSHLYKLAMKTSSLPIFRSLCVNFKNGYPIVDWENLGIHWSLKESGAFVCMTSNDGENKNKEDIMVKGFVDPKKIDWKTSYSNFNKYEPDQYEVTLYAGTPVYVNQIIIDKGFQQNHNNIINVKINANSGMRNFNIYDVQRNEFLKQLNKS